MKKAKSDAEKKLVFEGSSVDADFMNNILEDSGITTFLKNKNMGQLFPHYASTGGFNPVKIYVNTADYEKAVQMVERFAGKSRSGA